MKVEVTEKGEIKDSKMEREMKQKIVQKRKVSVEEYGKQQKEITLTKIKQRTKEMENEAQRRAVELTKEKRTKGKRWIGGKRKKW